MSDPKTELYEKFQIFLNNELDSHRFEGEIIQDLLSWLQVLFDLRSAQKKLDNFTATIKVKGKEPTYGDISFIDQNLSRYDSLKTYTGTYGFVVPINVGRSKRVLRGEKKMKYKG